MADMFVVKSLTGSKATYRKVGLVNGKLIRPAADGGVETVDGSAVVAQLKDLHISTAKPVELQVKIEGKYAHFQWAGSQKNREYGAAFDVLNPWAKQVTPISPEYLSEDEMA